MSNVSREQCADLAVLLAEQAGKSKTEFTASYYRALFLAAFDRQAEAAAFQSGTVETLPAATPTPADAEALVGQILDAARLAGG